MMVRVYPLKLILVEKSQDLGYYQDGACATYTNVLFLRLVWTGQLNEFVLRLIMYVFTDISLNEVSDPCPLQVFVKMSLDHIVKELNSPNIIRTPAS